MSTIATGSFEIIAWDEQLVTSLEGERRLAKAHAAARYEGGIEGEGKIDYLMAYKADGTAEFVGMERIVGRVGERDGALILQVSGTFDGETMHADWRIVRGAGSAELTTTSGGGSFHSGRGSAGRYRLECTAAR